jgi:hypothetical protein
MLYAATVQAEDRQAGVACGEAIRKKAFPEF